jgi:hypothetical protein
MPLTTSSHHHPFEEYRSPGHIPSPPHYTPRLYNSLLVIVLICRPLKTVLSRNPLQRVRQSEFPVRRRKANIISAPKKKLDPKTEIPTAASRWRKETLDLLNVNYDRSIITAFKFDGMKLPNDMQQRMT